MENKDATRPSDMEKLIAGLTDIWGISKPSGESTCCFSHKPIAYAYLV